MQQIRKGVYSIAQVLDNIRPDARKEARDVDFDGDLIHMDSLRYQVFKRSLICVSCGIEGKFMAKERNVVSGFAPDRWHFNLYAELDGVEVLMTKDHIHPRSKGGKDVLANLQTMCTHCNMAKGNSVV